MVSNSTNDDEWIMDSRCSFDMIFKLLWFQEFIELEGGSVLLVDDKSCKPSGVGTIKICLHDGIERVLEEVRFIPSLKRNLISLGELKKNDLFKGEGKVEGLIIVNMFSLSRFTICASLFCR